MKSEDKYSKAIDGIIQHIVNIGLEHDFPNTYESGLDMGARLMLAYLMRCGFVNNDNIEVLCETNLDN